MLLSQLAVALGLIGIVGASVSTPASPRSALFALVVAFSSSTQDIVVDAWRIEAAADSDELGLLSSAYQLGYRVAIIVTDALILIRREPLGLARCRTRRWRR